MTMQASGSMTTAQIRDELRLPSLITIPDQSTRWLTDKAAGNLVMPTDFYSKEGIKIVASTGQTGFSTVHNFGVLNFGPDYPGRTIRMLIFMYRKDGGLDLSGSQVQNITLGNVNPANIGCTSVWPSTAGIEAMRFASPASTPTGTSGTVSFTTTSNCHAEVHLLSIANAGANVNGAADTSSTGKATYTVNLTGTATNGYVFAAFMNHADSTGGFTAGVDAKYSAVIFGGIYFIRYGWRNRLAAGGTYTVQHTSGAFPGLLTANSRGA